MSACAYAELHARSNFSFLCGASHPEELVQRAHALGYRGLALTDECSLAGVVRAHGAAKACGLHLIIGSEFRLPTGLQLVLLATDRAAYGRLSALITLGRRNAVKGEYRLLQEDFEQGLDGCLCVWVPGDESRNQWDTQAAWLAEHFAGRAWIAVERWLQPGDTWRLEQLQSLGQAHGLPQVAAGGVCMHERGRRALLDVLTAIRLRKPVAAAGYDLDANGERHLRSWTALRKIYPQALLQQSLVIAERCSFCLDELRYEYPDELVPPGRSARQYLRQLTEAGMARRWPQGVADTVRDLIEHELVLIAELHYEPYFLTVHDIVAFARSRGILCQGRGSAANSAVCFCLGITEVDPTRMEMLFERFLSKERAEPPDIDVDFEHERREEVIQYLYQKYGRARAALAATVITYRRKSALRDVGKALGLDQDQLDRLVQASHGWDGRGLDGGALQAAGFDPKQPTLQRVLQLAACLRGFPRHLSQHVGGFVISRGPLSELVPIENAAMAERTVIQWDKDDLDLLGLLKVDCLSLGMLSAIRRSFDLIAQYTGHRYDMAGLPAEDAATYAMIQHADTVGVFQIESRAQMAMLPRLKPACFYDLVIEVAIVRPGPIQGDMVHPYLLRRQGKQAVSYPSEAVREVLARTLGVPIFQEQVIKLAMVAAGFSPGEADQLRRSMAAWRRRGGMDRLQQRLVEGMRARGYDEDFAQRIYQQILGFSEYGFPESHAASFALLVYVSAWLKCHEPAAFCCALLNSQPMGFYAPAQLTQDARRHGVVVRPVDVLHSDWDCTLEPPSVLPSRGQTRSQSRCVGSDPSGADHALHQQPPLRLGLRQIKGLSCAGAERLLRARTEKSFLNVDDLARRAALSRTDLEALAAADALQGLAGNRHQARWACAGVEAATPLWDAGPQQALPLLPVPTEGENLLADYASLGLSLGRHPLALLRTRLTRMGLVGVRRLAQCRAGKMIHIAGLVLCRQRPGSGSGVVFLTLEDEDGHSQIIVWPNIAERFHRQLLQARLLAVRGEVQREGEVVHVIARSLQDHSVLLGELRTRSRDFQ